MADFIEGKRPVIEALRTGVPIKSILMADNVQRDGLIEDILRKAKRAGTTVEMVPRKVLDGKSDRGSHQGVMAKAAPFPYVGIGDVIDAIETVTGGGSYFSPQLLTSLTGRMRTREDAADEQLSSREREILVAVCRGLSNQEIADELFISKRTVDKHRANILEKTGCKNTASLVVYAIRNGIVDI